MIKIADTVYQGYERENFVQENKCSYKTYLYNMYIKIQLHGSMCVNINCLRTRLLYFIFIFAFLNSGLVYLLNNTKQPSSGGLMTAVNVICTNFFGKKKNQENKSNLFEKFSHADTCKNKKNMLLKYYFVCFNCLWGTFTSYLSSKN